MSDSTEAKAKRRSYVIDLSTQSVTVFSADGENVGLYNLSDLPADVVTGLSLKGLSNELRGGKTEAEAFASLKSGNVPVRAPKAEAGLDAWRMACAHAAVEATKKSDAPLTLEAAKEKAAAFDRAKLSAAKKDPLVVKHYARLSGSGDGIASFFQ